MTDDILCLKKFNEYDQKNFAQLSGDFNPLHIDPIQARREIFGDVVVHGLHATAYALESYLEAAVRPVDNTIFLESISAKYLDPIYLNCEVAITQQAQQGQPVCLQIRQDNQVCQEITFQWRPISEPSSPSLSPPDFPTTPRDCKFDQFADHQDTISLGIDAQQSISLFPHITRAISQSQFATLLSLTRIVGMHCPGLQSVFSGFDIAFHSKVPATHIDYRVTRADKRFSSVQLEINNDSISGKIDTRYRPRCIEQPDFETLKSLAHTDEFKSQKALIIGGSRGIGETTAKLIAAGNGNTVITYHQGKQDAERVTSELISHTQQNHSYQQHTIGIEAQCIDFTKLKTPPTHLYYFASPKIIPQRGSLYTPQRFAHFSQFYVDALFDLYQRYRQKWETDHLHIFFPSTIYLDEPQKGLIEYCAAKAAGEALCAQLAKSDPNLTVTIKRLPQMTTDQTMSFMNKQFAKPHDVLLPILRHIKTHSS